MGTTFASFAFGCRVNEAEKIVLNEKLIQEGFTYSELTPDVYIINSCAVTGKAEREVRQKIYQIRRLFPKTVLVVTGCAATLWKIQNLEIPEIDLLVTNNDKHHIPRIISDHVSYLNDHTNDALNDTVIGQGRTFSDKFLNSKRLMVKIQDGCDRYCSYCIVPSLRGTPKSVLIKDIITSINDQKGIDEVILTAINTDVFGKDTGESLTDLIDAVQLKTSVPKISFGSIHPWSLTPKFFKYYKSILHLNRFVSFFHIPIQSGSDTVLKRMNRRYTTKKILSILKEIKRINPYAFIGTDIIVGFPGETENEFYETVQFLKKAQIDKIHVFRYSTRPGTLAQKMELTRGKITEEEKRKRSKILRELNGITT